MVVVYPYFRKFYLIIYEIQEILPILEVHLFVSKLPEFYGETKKQSQFV